MKGTSGVLRCRPHNDVQGRATEITSVQRSISAPERVAPEGPRPVAPDEPERPAYLTHQQILVVLAGLLAGMLLAALDQSIVGVALPRIVSELGGLDQLSWVVIAYLLATTATTPLWGKIS